MTSEELKKKLEEWHKDAMRTEYHFLEDETELRMGAETRVAALCTILRDALDHIEELREGLLYYQTDCTHDENDENYRPMGDNYGWCSVCTTKVTYKKNVARALLDKRLSWELNTNTKNNSSNASSSE